MRNNRYYAVLDSAPKEKDKILTDLKSDIDRFLEAGGSIKQIPIGVSGVDGNTKALMTQAARRRAAAREGDKTCSL